jgi:uncharacterized protein
MPETTPPLDLTKLSLSEIARALGQRQLLPVNEWQPQHCGHSGMRIARDGGWWHAGSPITRPALVRLFASLLRQEGDGRYVLVTPVEKLDVAVDDAPFVAVAVKSEGEGRNRRLAFQLNTDDIILADAAHPLSLRAGKPYLLVRDRLEALLTRPVYLELAELALAEADDPPGLWSTGQFFALADG